MENSSRFLATVRQNILIDVFFRKADDFITAFQFDVRICQLHDALAKFYCVYPSPSS